MVRYIKGKPVPSHYHSFSTSPLLTPSSYSNNILHSYGVPPPPPSSNTVPHYGIQGYRAPVSTVLQNTDSDVYWLPVSPVIHTPDSVVNDELVSHTIENTDNDLYGVPLSPLIQNTDSDMYGAPVSHVLENTNSEVYKAPVSHVIQNTDSYVLGYPVSHVIQNADSDVYGDAVSHVIQNADSYPNALHEIAVPGNDDHENVDILLSSDNYVNTNHHEGYQDTTDNTPDYYQDVIITQNIFSNNVIDGSISNNDSLLSNLISQSKTLEGASIPQIPSSKIPDQHNPQKYVNTNKVIVNKVINTPLFYSDLHNFKKNITTQSLLLFSYK